MRILAILALTVPAAALAQAPATSPAPAGDEQVCRVTNVIGSRLHRIRTCKTRAEWEELRRAQRHSIDRAQTRQYNRTVDEAIVGGN